MKKKGKYFFKFAILTLLFFAVLVISICIGRYRINLFNRLSRTDILILKNIRLPRILCAIIVGASLSVAGTAFQGMFRNPMVSPDLLGASTGAGFGAALAILAGGSYFSVTLSSFVSGIMAVCLAYSISKASKLHSSLALILSGMVVGSLFSSGTSFVKLVADTESKLPAITYWLMGSLASVSMNDVLFALIPIAVGLIPLFLLSWRINLLTVSEVEAKSMGVNTSNLRLAVIICATLVTSSSVAISGMIGWVGLVVPHFARLLFGQDNKRLIPASALLGSTFLLLTDDLSRIVFTSEIPLGIMTSVVGAPVFVFLILSRGNVHEH